MKLLLLTAGTLAAELESWLRARGIAPGHCDSLAAALKDAPAEAVWVEVSQGSTGAAHESQRMVEKERLSERGREMDALEHMAHNSSTSSTAASLGLLPVRAAAPELFASLVTAYAEALEAAVEQRAFGTAADLPERLQSIAQQLGHLSAGPRDVIEIHAAALKKKLTPALPARAQACCEEARLLALAVMGHLASYYRGAGPARRAAPLPPALAEGGSR